jgi:integrase
MVYQRGKGKTYWLRFMLAGKIYHESARTLSKKEALRTEARRKAELRQSPRYDIPAPRLPPFRDAAAEWLLSREGLVSPNTLALGRGRLKRLLPAFGGTQPSDITPQDVARYQQARLRQGAQGRTVNMEVQVLRQILKASRCWRHLEGEVHALRERRGIGKALSPEDEGRLLDECARSGSACHTAAVLALNTAMRGGELRGLKWGQVDFARRILTVGESKTEAGTGRLIPLNRCALDALERWGGAFPGRRPEECVFPHGWRTAWRNALRRAGLRLRFHDLRHTAISKLGEAGAPEQAIMAIAGHISRRMLERYSHIRMDAKRRALDSIVTKTVTKRECQTGTSHDPQEMLAGTTGLEPATSCVTGMRSNQLNYVPAENQ